MSRLDALPIFQGGKRHLLDTIFDAIEALGYPPDQGFRLTDPFMGGGSVSLQAKGLGYRVLANDFSPRSEAVGRALIENDRVKLTDADLERALDFEVGDWWMPPARKLAWPEPARKLLVQVTAAAEEFGEPRRSLLRALMFKTATRIAMWGQPIALEPGRSIRKKQYDQLTKAQMARIPVFTQPTKVLLREARKLSEGVFSNGEKNTMSRMDAVDFLEQLGDGADVAYFDPPYPETEHYERHYWSIDGILDNAAPDPKPSRFSRAGGWRHLGDVFDAAEGIPAWVISMGDRAHRGELEHLLQERGRVVQTALALPGAHIPAKANKDAERYEMLLVARKENH